MTTSEAALRVRVVVAGAQGKPAALLPLAQTEGPTSASPGQGNLPDTSGPGGEGLAQGLKAGAAGLGAQSHKSGFPGRGSFCCPPPRGCAKRGVL